MRDFYGKGIIYGKFGLGQNPLSTILMLLGTFVTGYGRRE